MAKHVTLIGMMGAGKSSVAPLLAARLGRGVIEVDDLIEKQEGTSIGDIFMAKGEAYFRRVECALIKQLIAQPPAVLSLGGGAFQWDETRELLLAQTVVIYLFANADVLSSRLESTTANRPLLNVPGIDVHQTIRELLERRSAFYDQAHYRVETDFHDPEDVAKSVSTLREAYE